MVNDPIGRKVLSDAVSPETAARTIGDELGSQAAASTPETNSKAQAWQRMNQHLANLLGSHPTQSSRDNLRTSASVLVTSFGLETVGITEKELAGAIKKTVDIFEKELAKRVKTPTSLNQEATDKLGTRATVVNLGYNAKGHRLNQSRSYYSSDAMPPPYFPTSMNASRPAPGARLTHCCPVTKSRSCAA